jgi:hypothetical protein
MSARANAVQAGAELLIEHAQEYGERCGLPKDIAAVEMLEQAYAIAVADVALFKGANDTPERLAETIKTMAPRIAALITLQHHLRRGHKPGLIIRPGPG